MKINDLSIYPLSDTPLLPLKAGDSIIQAPFNTPILRVTDNIVDGDGSFAVAYSSIFDSWNYDSTTISYIDIPGTSFWLADFDSVKFTIGNKRRVPAAPEGRSINSLYWSRKDPSYYYIVTSGPAIFKVDKNSGVYTLVCNVPTIDTSIFIAPGIDSRGMSDDEVRFRIHCTINGNPCITVVDVVRNAFVFRRIMPSAGATKGELSACGRYCTGGDGLLYNIDEKTAVCITGNGSDDPEYGDVHPDWGYFPLPDGNKAFWASGGMMQAYPGYRYFPSQVKQYVAPSMMGQADHTSFRCKRVENNGDIWFLTTEYTADIFKKPGLFWNEIVSFPLNGKPDGSINRRICHHYTSSKDYWAQGQGNQSQDGRFVLFCSDAMGLNGHLYIAKIKDSVGTPYGPYKSATPNSNPDFLLRITPGGQQQIKPGTTIQFKAITTAGSVISNNVVWSINPQLGTISSTGLYTAPNVVTNRTFVNVSGKVAGELSSAVLDVVANAPTDTIPVTPPGPTPTPIPPTGTTQFTAEEVTTLKAWAAFLQQFK